MLCRSVFQLFTLVVLFIAPVEVYLSLILPLTLSGISNYLKMPHCDERAFVAIHI